MRVKALKPATLIAVVSMLIFTRHSLAAAAAGTDKPNFLIIVADDMGYSDAGCYGGEVETPALQPIYGGAAARPLTEILR